MSERKDVISNVLGSATAGLVARTLCHPIDTAKSRLQSNEYKNYSNTFTMLRDTFRREGIRGLYRGFGAVTVGGIPGVCVYLTVYEMAKDKLISSSSNISSFLAYFVSGLIAEAACCVVFVPVDVIKERIQVQKPVYSYGSEAVISHEYKGSLEAAKHILRLEGLSGIYKGYGATLLSYGPFSALYFLFYEKSKQFTTPSGTDISFSMAVICSAISGSAASYITSPLDMAKLRLQIQRVSPVQGQERYSGLFDCLVKVYRTDGIKGLFRGAGARVLFHTPSTAITMGLFEQCKRFWAKLIHE